jgi:hypothetical protein
MVCGDVGNAISGSRYICKYGKCGYGKMKIKIKWGMVGDDIGGAILGSRVQFQI